MRLMLLSLTGLLMFVGLVHAQPATRSSGHRESTAALWEPEDHSATSTAYYLPSGSGGSCCATEIDSSCCECGGCCDCCEPASGCWIGGIEVAALQLRLGGPDDLNTTTGVLAPVSSPDYDFEVAPRAWVGYQGAGGLGIRARGFTYRTSGSINNGPTPSAFFVNPIRTAALTQSSVASRLKMNVFDLEITQQGEFSNWEFQMVGGIRYARLDFDTNISGVVTFTPDFPVPASAPNFISGAEDSNFWGMGPTVAFEGRRPLFGWDGLALISGARYSLLFGESERNVAGTAHVVSLNGPYHSRNDDPVSVLELKVGLEYSTTMTSGARLFVAGFVEGQAWDWAAAPGIFGDELGLWGPSLSIGLER